MPLKKVQKTFHEPRILLQSIKGIQYEVNIVQSKLSMKHLDYKMEKVKETSATTFVTTNPGCLLQMKLGIEREGLSDKIQAVHIVELLAKALYN